MTVEAATGDLSGRGASTPLVDHSWTSLPTRPLVLVPVGSCEQHGPHLPLDTDSVVAVAVASGVASALVDGHPTGSVVVAPVIAYGASGEHQTFPGTVSIGHDALGFQLVELVRSLSTWAGRIVFVNGHGGNVATLSSVVPQMMVEGHEVAWAACAVQGMDSHAGHAETSLMLHLAPSRVDITLAVPGNVAALAELLPTLRSEGVAGVSASGVLGDPTGATAEHGSALLVEMIRDVHSRIMAAAVGRDGRLTRPASTLTGSLT